MGTLKFKFNHQQFGFFPPSIVFIVKVGEEGQKQKRIERAAQNLAITTTRDVTCKMRMVR